MATIADPELSVVKRKKISRGQLLINGTWRDARDGATMPTSDPTTEEIITEVAKASPQDADEAVDAAYKAFAEGPWNRMHLEQRAKLLFRVADLLDERAEDFAVREAMDMGMPYRDFLYTIMPTCSGLFRFFGGLCMSAMNGGYRTSYEPNMRILTRREPLGVVAAITPFNFPLTPRPLLQTSSPLKPKINRGLTLGLVRQTGALQKSRSSPTERCGRPRSAMRSRLL